MQENKVKLTKVVKINFQNEKEAYVALSAQKEWIEGPICDGYLQEVLPCEKIIVKWTVPTSQQNQRKYRYSLLKCTNTLKPYYEELLGFQSYRLLDPTSDLIIARQKGKTIFYEAEQQELLTYADLTDSEKKNFCHFLKRNK